MKTPTGGINMEQELKDDELKKVVGGIGEPEKEIIGNKCAKSKNGRHCWVINDRKGSGKCSLFKYCLYCNISIKI